MKTILKLFIAGETAPGKNAVMNLNEIINKTTGIEWCLEIIDIYKDPKSAIDGRIIAVPALIKASPPPIVKIIGDLSDTERILSLLEPADDV